MTEKLVKVRVEGVSPLLVCAFTDEAAMAATEGTPASNSSGDRGSPREQAEALLYKNSDGAAIIPGPNLYRSLMEAGKFHKVGKKQVTTQKTSLVPSGLWIDDIVIPLESEEGWTVDTRPVRIPATGGRILRHRPIFNDWALSFGLRVDTNTFSLKFARQLLDDAGSKLGLGDFRPECKGPFGRYKVTLWKES